MHGKLRIERYFPDATDATDRTDPTSDPTPPGPELVPPHTPGSPENSEGPVRPYCYRVPKGTPPPTGDTPPKQRRSTDDEPTRPVTK
jgi:hypothetical protein